jgi:hypothetical protein
MAASRCRTKSSSIGIGFSHHRVPSLSNTATRSSGGTNSGDPSVVTRSTNSRIAVAAGPSFQLARCSSATAYFCPRARASSSRPILERPGRFRRFASS